jgi:hypothetical protein
MKPILQPIGSLKVLGCSYSCEVSGDFETATDFGDVNCDKQKMHFCVGIPDSLFERVILHELIEIIKKQMLLRIPHDDIDRLDACLYEALKANGVDLKPLRDAVTGGKT